MVRTQRFKIKVKTLQLIDEVGTNLGVMQRETAEGLAAAKGLELVLVQQERGGTSAVYRMVTKKQLWENKKREKKARKKDARSVTKEISFTTNIEEHDLSVKVNHMREFLEKTYGVLLSVETRARREEEIARDRGRQRELLAKVAKELASVGTKSDERIVGRKLQCRFRSLV